MVASDGLLLTVIIEGVSSMRKELGQYWDFGVWVEAPYELRLARGVTRDGERMDTQWRDVWMPEEQEYFDAQRPDKKADLIVDGTRPARRLVGQARSRARRRSRGRRTLREAAAARPVFH